MCRNDELRVLCDHVLHHHHERELALGAQGRLRLIQEIDSARYEPRLEQPKKALTVGVGVEIDPVTTLHVVKRCPGRTHGQTLGPRGSAGVLDFQIGDPLEKLGPQSGHSFRESEEVFGAQKEPPMRLPVPRQLERRATPGYGSPARRREILSPRGCLACPPLEEKALECQALQPLPGYSLS